MRWRQQNGAHDPVCDPGDATRIGRALLAGDARDGAVIRVNVIDGDPTVPYENLPEE